MHIRLILLIAYKCEECYRTTQGREISPAARTQFPNFSEEHVEKHIYPNGVARGGSWMDDHFKYSEVYGEGNEVESWSRNNGDGWSPRCFKSLEYYNWKID